MLSAISARIASRSDGRLTPSCVASCRSGGSRCPARSSPATIMRLIVAIASWATARFSIVAKLVVIGLTTCPG
jgi:hypothetical protein